jgi:hypothetical protein
MPLPESSRCKFTSDLTICRVLNGLWQVSGAHGRIDRRRAIEEMFAGVIVGARLGVTEHLADNARVFSFTLDEADRATIETVLEKSHDLFKSIGDCGDEYR